MERQQRFNAYEKNLHDSFKRSSKINIDKVILKVSVQEEPTIYKETTHEVDLKWKPKLLDELDNKTFLIKKHNCMRCGKNISDEDSAIYSNITKFEQEYDEYEVCEHCECLIDGWLRSGNGNKSYEY